MGTKIKRGTELSLNGTSVWCDLDSGGDCVFICYQKTRDVTKHDEFEWIPKADLKPAKKTGSTINNKPKKLTVKEKTDKELMNEFFLSLHPYIPFNCQNCNKPLYAYTNWAKRCISGHILPKAQFESVAIIKDNIMFLGSSLLCICTCHNLWDDKGAEERKAMPVYQQAIDQFYTYQHRLNDKDLIDAYEYLGLKTEDAINYINSK